LKVTVTNKIFNNRFVQAIYVGGRIEFDF